MPAPDGRVVIRREQAFVRPGKVRGVEAVVGFLLGEGDRARTRGGEPGRTGGGPGRPAAGRGGRGEGLTTTRARGGDGGGRQLCGGGDERGGRGGGERREREGRSSEARRECLLSLRPRPRPLGGLGLRSDAAQVWPNAYNPRWHARTPSPLPHRRGARRPRRRYAAGADRPEQQLRALGADHDGVFSSCCLARGCVSSLLLGRLCQEGRATVCAGPPKEK